MHYYNDMGPRNYRTRYISTFVAAKESREAAKKEESAADTARREAEQIAKAAEEAEAQAEAEAKEAARKKLASQTKTIFAGALGQTEEEKTATKQTTFGA